MIPVVVEDFLAPGIIWRIEALDAVESTQDLVLARAQAGEPQGLVIQARSQSVGRGRLGTDWRSPLGNLYMSALLRPDVPQARLGELAFVCGLGVLDGVLPFARTRDLKLKWPNDILMEGRKLCGILIETDFHALAKGGVCIGIGINIASPPEGAVGLGEKTGQSEYEKERDSVRDSVLKGLTTRLAQWRNTGFGIIRQDWLSVAHGIGQPVRVRQASGITNGIFRDIDDAGALILYREEKGQEKTERILAGEILVETGR